MVLTSDRLRVSVVEGSSTEAHL